MLMVGDFGKDLDDEFAMLLAVALARRGYVRLLGVIANLNPALERARLAKGTLEAVGFGHVPVSVGMSVTMDGRTPSHETDVSYLADASRLFGDGQELLRRVLTDSAEPVTLVLNSALTDVVAFIKTDADLFLRRVGHVAIMGGVRVTDDGHLIPDDAANNEFDLPAAEFIYRWLRDNRVPTTVLMREAAYVCQMVAWMPVMLAELGHPVGLALARRLPLAMDELWQAVHAEPGSTVRGRLPVSRTRDWYVRTSMWEQDPGIPGDQPAWPFVQTFRLYDPMNVLAAVPELARRFYDPERFEINGVTHRVIGRVRGNHCVHDPNDLRGALAHYIREALECSI
ncbi:hypothetical protein A2501_00270 [Candidatus Uhrbacteria bacterium RIFOXYC12_FULL_57_11]|nr:MAG: hypothetical protein A2501_00270 [Candidatus Uhrbacteria bacterium RIFOXYC12_FULL_57_11]